MRSGVLFAEIISRRLRRRMAAPARFLRIARDGKPVGKRICPVAQRMMHKATLQQSIEIMGLELDRIIRIDQCRAGIAEFPVRR